jgi:hypothetical protein
VWTYAASPCSHAFRRASSSSSRSNRQTGLDRAEDLLVHHAGRGGGVGQHRRRDEVAGPLEGPAGERHARAAPDGVVDELLQPPRLAGPDRGAEVDARLGPAAGEQVAEALGEQLGEGPRDRRLDVERVGGRAGRAAVAHLRGHGALDGGSEVGVGEDDEGRLAPELEARAEHPVGGQREEVPPDGRRACAAGGSASSASVASSSDETTTFRTPGGAPASSTIPASARADSGVRADGRKTTVQPAASGAATPRAGIASGKFHGLTIRHGPTGRRVTMTRAEPFGSSQMEPWTRTASSADHSRYSAAKDTSTRDSASGFPISRVISMARRPASRSSASAARRSTRARSRGAAAAQAAWAS